MLNYSELESIKLTAGAELLNPSKFGFFTTLNQGENSEINTDFNHQLSAE